MFSTVRASVLDEPWFVLSSFIAAAPRSGCGRPAGLPLSCRLASADAAPADPRRRRARPGRAPRGIRQNPHGPTEAPTQPPGHLRPPPPPTHGGGALDQDAHPEEFAKIVTAPGGRRHGPDAARGFKN